MSLIIVCIYLCICLCVTVLKRILVQNVLLKTLCQIFVLLTFIITLINMYGSVKTCYCASLFILCSITEEFESLYLK